MPARRFPSLLGAASVVVLVLVLGACTPGGQFDPTEALSTDIFSTKKKLQGEREPLFPQGVPGTETGVPPDLVKGYQPPPEQAAVGEGNPRPSPLRRKSRSPNRSPGRKSPIPRWRRPSGAVALAASAVFAGAGTAGADQLAIACRPTRADQLAAAARPARTGGRPDKLAAAAGPARTGGRRPDKLAGTAAADAVRRKTALAGLA